MIKSVILLPAALIVGLYLFFGHIMPLFGDVLTAREELVSERAALSQEQARLAQAQEVAKQVAQRPNEKEFMERFVPSDPYEQYVINTVQQFANERGASFFTASFEDQERAQRNGDLHGSTLGELVFVGGYAATKTLLQDISLLQRLQGFREIVVERVDVEEGQVSDILNTTVVLQYPYLTEDFQSSGDMPLENLFSRIAEIAKDRRDVPDVAVSVQPRINPFLP